MALEVLVAEPGTDLADRLVALAVVVLAGEVEGAVDVETLALAVVCADDDQVERVADAGEVVLLQLRAGNAFIPGDGSEKVERTLSQLTLRLEGS